MILAPRVSHSILPSRTPPNLQHLQHTTLECVTPTVPEWNPTLRSRSPCNINSGYLSPTFQVHVFLLLKREPDDYGSHCFAPLAAYPESWARPIAAHRLRNSTPTMPPRRDALTLMLKIEKTLASWETWRVLSALSDDLTGQWAGIPVRGNALRTWWIAPRNIEGRDARRVDGCVAA
jgi:hypothetical protein